eukprot:gene48625-65215_t
MESNTESTELEALQRINDRLSSAPNDTLGQLLPKLLPKLLLLSNQENLRSAVLPIFSNILKRVKPLKIELPCAEILGL